MVINAAIRDCAAHRHDDTPLPDEEKYWRVGKTLLGMKPIFVEEEEERPFLTWDLWRDTIEGIRGFLIHYPGVYPGLEIYYADPDDDDEWLIGGAEMAEL